MAADKVGTKGGGGFLNLFDWNRKSRKKLFASVSPEGTKQASKSDDSLAAVRTRLNDDDDEIRGLASVKESSDFSCNSSVTDEDGIATRAPGVVARLMGLDSLPTTGGSETFSTPLFESRSSRGSRCPSRSLGFEVNNPLTLGLLRTEAYSSKAPELKHQKMPSSPIEKFQTEMLPPRSAKSLPITYYRSLSPVKKPRFISSDEAAHIMEAAAKILDPKFQATSSTRAFSIGSSSLSSKARDSKEHVQPLQRASSSLESSRKLTEPNTTKQLTGQFLKKKCNAPENNSSYRSPSDWHEANSVEVKDKGKSISLATQAKVNIHQKGSMSMSGRNSQDPKEQDDFKLKRLNIQKNKQQKRVSMPSTSGVLKQNNQKQNCLTSKDKLSAKSSVTNQQAKKGSSVGAYSGRNGRNKSLNKLQANLKNGYGKDGLGTACVEKDTPSKTNGFPGKEQLIYGNYHTDSSALTTNILVGKLEKHLQPSIFVDEHTKWGKDGRKNATDIVSFTFNSPIGKAISGSQPSMKMKEKQESGDNSITDIHGMNAEDAKNKPKTSLGLGASSGNDLSILLEQKLRELTMELESDHSSQIDTCHATSASTLQDLFSASEITAEAGSCEAPWKQYKDNIEKTSNSELFLINDQVCNLSKKFQESNSLIECTSRSDAHMQVDLQHPSPFPVLEASFSIESCCSSLSTDGSQLCSSVQQGQENARCSLIKKLPSVETEIDLCDSASSVSESVDGEHDGSIEIEYVRDILSTADLNSESSCSFTCGVLDSVIFHQLENKKSRFRSSDEDGRRKRKVLFDCVSECLDLKRSCYLSTGYQSWTKGVELVGKSVLAEEIYKEITGWRGMENWMVDELVNKDMSCYLGRRVGFETDACATGVEIQGEILGVLLDEIVDEFFA